MSNLDKVLAERGSKYGKFEDHAKISQDIKQILQDNVLFRSVLLNYDVPPYITEGLDMIAHKLGRIANGDPFYDDSWVDIAGYATLVANILKERNAK